jgi:hypothetical protein
MRQLSRNKIRYCGKINAALSWQTMHPETEKLIRELEAWCRQVYGRRSGLARLLDVSPGTVGDWISGRRMPTLDQGNEIKRIIRRR